MSTAPRVAVRVLDPRLHEWGLPARGTDWAAGIDLRACVGEPLTLEAGAAAVLVPTGLAMAMGESAMAALVLARSGLGHRHGVVLGQAVGLIDADYLGEIFVSLWLRPGMPPFTIAPGDRVAQLVFVPVLRPVLDFVEAFAGDTARGTGGFGSTGVG